MWFLEFCTSKGKRKPYRITSLSVFLSVNTSFKGMLGGIKMKLILNYSSLQSCEGAFVTPRLKSRLTSIGHNKERQ